MKTNRKKPFILATLALGLVLVMGLGANTFAKYITADAGNDTARVAKWGVTVEVENADLFGKEYTANVVSEDDTDAEVYTDAANGDNNLVAPGTTGYATVDIKGTPEVAVNVKVDIIIVDNVGVDTYYPLTWTVAGKNGSGNADGIFAGKTLTFDTADADDVTAYGVTLGDRFAVITIDQDFAPANDLDLDSEMRITWNWAFYVDEATDVKDTAIGSKGTLDSVSVSIAATVTQLDTHTNDLT